MKLLKEEINSISKEANVFIKENPEYAEQVKAFEQEWEIKDSLTSSQSIIDYLNDNVYLSLEKESYDSYIKSEKFGKPSINNAYYYVDNDGNIGIDLEVEWEGTGTEYSHPVYDSDIGNYWYDESNVNITATAYEIIIKIPKDIINGDYDIEGDDDIEYSW